MKIVHRIFFFAILSIVIVGDFFINGLKKITPHLKKALEFIASIFYLLFVGLAEFTKAVFIHLRSITTSPYHMLRHSMPRISRMASRASAHKKKKVRASKRERSTGYSFGLLSKLKFFTLGVIFSCIFVFFPLLIFLFASDLPSPYNLSVTSIPQTTKIYDRNGTLLYEIFANQNRTIVPLSEIPKQLQEATIAIEDKDFYNHIGIDLRGIIRAALSNLQQNSLQGGSTITQQLIKSAFLTPETTLQRKIKEVVLAFWAERIYTKNEILELYFNYVPYGGTAWGIGAASDVYFGKKIQDLTLAESAFLAGIPRAPTIYSPYSGDNSLWKRRQKEVLDAMVKQDYITTEEANEAYKQELTFRPQDVPIKAPHFVMFVRDYLISKYGISQVERGGLQVKTSLDLTLQEQVETIVKNEVDANANLQISNGASIVVNPKTGEILAMVGSRDYFDRERDGNVNITTSLRQPGSTVKLITYTLALQNGFTESSLIDDSPLVIPQPGSLPYIPVNYDGKFRGRVPFRLALANSLNIPAVRLAQSLGVQKIVDLGQSMGIKSWNEPEKYGLSITLGGAEVRMIELAQVYSVIANDGKKVDFDPVLSITDGEGKEIYQASPKETPVVDPGVAFIISDILSDNNARSMGFGPNSALNIPGRRVSVKTGTTDNKRDNWTVGYTPNYLVATWVGNNDNTPMSQAFASGITGAAPMWNKIITNIIKDKVDPSLSIPSNIVKKSCFGRDAYFLAGTENSGSCTMPSPTQPQNQQNRNVNGANTNRPGINRFNF